jgi:hypothetical protein
MTFDALTIAGLSCIASFALMPVLMGREFIRVESDDETALRSSRRRAQNTRPQHHPKPLTPNAATHA